MCLAATKGSSCQACLPRPGEGQGRQGPLHMEVAALWGAWGEEYLITQYLEGAGSRGPSLSVGILKVVLKYHSYSRACPEALSPGSS